MCSLAADSVDRGALAAYLRLIERDTVPEDVIYRIEARSAQGASTAGYQIAACRKGLDMKTRLALGVALADRRLPGGRTDIQ